MTVIKIAQMSGQRPSEIISVDDDYTAFCFDEAVYFIISELKKGNEPCFSDMQQTTTNNEDAIRWLQEHRG